jgi:hypothetical protein
MKKRSGRTLTGPVISVSLHHDPVPRVDQPPDVDRERLELGLDLREDVLQNGLRAPEARRPRATPWQTAPRIYSALPSTHRTVPQTQCARLGL